MWGITAGQPIKTLERQGVPVCRLQESGTREVVCVPVVPLMEYAAEAGLPTEIGEAYQDRVKRACDSILDDDALNAFGMKGGVLFRGVVRPGNFMYVPAGHLLVERCLGTTNCYGYRTAAFGRSETSTAAFRRMLEQARTLADKSDPLVKFWCTVAEELK